MVEEHEQAPVQQPAPLLQLLQRRSVSELDAALQLPQQRQRAVPVRHEDLRDASQEGTYGLVCVANRTTRVSDKQPALSANALPKEETIPSGIATRATLNVRNGNCCDTQGFQFQAKASHACIAVPLSCRTYLAGQTPPQGPHAVRAAARDSWRLRDFAVALQRGGRPDVVSAVRLELGVGVVRLQGRVFQLQLGLNPLRITRMNGNR